MHTRLHARTIKKLPISGVKRLRAINESSGTESANPSDLVKHKPEELSSETETGRPAQHDDNSPKRAKLDDVVNKI